MTFILSGMIPSVFYASCYHNALFFINIFAVFAYDILRISRGITFSGFSMPLASISIPCIKRIRLEWSALNKTEIESSFLFASFLAQDEITK